MLRLTRYLLPFAILILLFSCSSDNNQLEIGNFYADNLSQKWELFKETGSMAGAVLTGEAMEWQESYIFKTDGTFLKTRETDGKTQTASGKYTISSQNSQQTYILEYQEENAIIGSCTPLKEYLTYKPDENILVNDWGACDGPSLYYRRIE